MKKILLASFVFVAAFAVAGAPALAHHHHGDDVTVSNGNWAVVKNSVSAKADTGDNVAGGSAGGEGGNGGVVSGTDNNNNHAQGGNGGAGGIGGSVYTGDATAYAGVENRVNSNRTSVSLCGCEDNNDGDVEVTNNNWAVVKNRVRAKADTGDNVAGGSNGGNGGSAGTVGGAYNDGNDVDGGNGGAGNDGGWISTGDANASAGVLNIVNKNITRIRR